MATPSIETLFIGNDGRTTTPDVEQDCTSFETGRFWQSLTATADRGAFDWSSREPGPSTGRGSVLSSSEAAEGR